MKIPALLTLLLAALLAALPARRACAQEASFDLFYNNLADDGDWYNTPDFGYVWHPAIADGNDKWRPYTDGYWAQTDEGWAWVSYESFGWATYHYGRWTRLQSIGWAWVPGYQWGPGWVSWRTSDEYVGWAPLPPRPERGSPAVSVDYNDVEAVEDGYTAAVDQDYDIGPDNYCFVAVRQFGAPVLSEVILPPQRNLLFIGTTSNVTNIYYRRSPDRTVVYNTGPDFAFVDAHVERPIQRLRIDRRENIGYLRENGSGNNPTVVKNGVLLVAAPLIARRTVNFEQVKPARVKQVIAQPQIVHGWSESGGDPRQVQLLRERFKNQAQAAPRQARADLPPQGVAPAPELQAIERRPADPSVQGSAAADRAARRAAQREQDVRDETRGTGQNPPAKAAPAPDTVQPQTLPERVARKRAQAQAQTPAPAVATPAPKGQTPPRPAPTLNPEEDRIVHQPARQARAQAETTLVPTPAPNARDSRRDARPAQPAPGQPQPQDDPNAARNARRSEREPQAQRAPAAQTPPEQAPRRNERQQPTTPAPGNSPAGNGDDKKKHEN